MKYTEDQFKRVLECFNASARVAALRGSSTFICMPLYDTLADSLIKPCKSYCPVYEDGIMGECSAAHDAAYWQFAKEKFIVENEPQGSEDIKMKYTREQFDAVIECFDSTIEFADKIGTVSFNCNPLYEVVPTPCFHYCPLYRIDSTSECFSSYDAQRWRALKEQFIAEHEPED